MANLVGESPKAWQVELPPDFHRAPLYAFRYPSFTERSLTAFKYWLLPMTDGVRSTGLEGSNNRLHSDRSFAASLLQTGA